MANLLNRLFGGAATSSPTPQPTPAQQEMDTLLETAAAALEQGFHETALETYQRGLTLARALEDARNIELFLNGLGAAYVQLERYDEARTALEEALQIARTLESPRELARCLNNLGTLHAAREEWGEAQTYHRQALEAARQSDDTGSIALALESLARDALHQDNPNYAQHLLKEAVILSQANGQHHITARVLGLLGEATQQVGDRTNAAKLFEQALHFARQTQQEALQLRWLQTLAQLALEAQQYRQAILYLQEAENLALRLGDQPPEFFMHSALDLTTAYQQIGDTAQAEEYATRALAQARSTGNAAHEASALTRLGVTAYAANDLPRALSFLTEAQALYDAQAVHDPNEHMQILLALGNVALRQRRLEEAQQYAERLLALAEQHEDTARQAEAHQLLGYLAAQRRDRQTASAHWDEALRLLGRDARTPQVAQLRCDIAQAHRQAGNYRAALDEYEKALMLLSNIDHLPTRGLVLGNAATVYTEMGDEDTAQAFYEEAVAIAQRTGDQRAEAVRLGNWGCALTLTGQPRLAVEKLERALAISRALDDTLMIAVQTNNLARAYAALGDHQTAHALHKQALAAATAIDAPQWAAMFRADLGLTLEALGRPEDAEAVYRQALSESEAAADLETQIHARTRLARLLAQREHLEEAATLAEQALAQARRMHYRRGIADAQRALGDVARQRGDAPAAERHYREAYKLYTILHDPTARTVAALLPDEV